MGTGSGTGVGTGKGVKGSWRVSAFLLLLTGWQAVLLPWSSLILKDAGFSATRVGLLSGVTTLAASVGVVACLRAMRRSRSGAVRRMLLLLLFAGSTLLQGCGVVILLQYIPHTGLLQSCVSRWPITPTTAVIPLNMSTPSAVSAQRPQSLAPTTNTTTTTTTTTSTSIAPTLIPSTSTSTTTTTSTSTTVPPVRLPSIPPTTTTTTTSTSATRAQVAIVPTAAVTSTSRPSHVTIPAVQTTQKPNDKVPVNSSATTVQSLTSGYLEEGEGDHPEGEGEEAIGTGDAVKAPHMPPVTKGNPKTAYNTKVKSSHKHDHNSYVSPDDSERDALYHMMTKHRHKSPHDKDHLTPQDNNSEDDTSSQDLDEDDGPKEDEDETDEVDYEDTQPKHINNYSRLSGKSSPPSSGFQHDVRAAKPWKPQPRRPPSRHETAVQNPPDNDFFFPKTINLNGKSASLLNNQVDTRPRLNPSLPLRLLPPLKNAVRPHYPAQPRHPASASTAETHVVEDLPGGDWQYDDRDGQVKARHTKYRRSRRNTHHADSGDHAPAAKADGNETLPQKNKTLDSKWNPVEGVANTGLEAAVAVLLALGGLLGAGVEASVAQLWHCYVHGYDEGGVSQDVLQRTITHTFHLSAYGSHKSWTGITSGGWAMVAGVVSILSCLVGTGGSGYGGLLGVHLALGLASLLVLLILPVPYGSIDPPKTRRPLSLYLDDEVLREGVRRLTFHLWVFVNGCLAALSLTFSLWLLQEMTTEGWLVGSQAAAVGVTLVCESLALHTQRRLVTRWGMHGVMGVCGVSLMLHYGVMWASENVGVVVAAHVGLGVAMAFQWVSVKHNALLLATVSDQEREAWASWWCWRFGVGVGAAVWSVGVSGAGGRVRPLLLLAALIAAILASVLCVTAVLSRRLSRTRRRVYHTLDLDMADEEEEVEEDAAENDWLVKRAKKEGLTL